MKETKRINFSVPVEVHTALKTAAAANNMSIKMFILRLLIEELGNIGAIKIK